MGGAQSYFDETDWNLADGGLMSAAQTLDGRPPTQSYQCYDLIKRSIVANQREFHVTDQEKNLLFQIRPIPGTIAGFDVLGVGSAKNDDFILRVTVDLARRTWIIYRFHTPVFEGQLPDPVATDKFSLEQQQQQMNGGNDRKELAARISASLQVHSFSDDRPLDEEEVLPKEKPKPTHFLYKVGCVTVSWSRYMAVAAYYGPPTIDQIMVATEKAAAAAKEAQNLKASKSQDEEDLFLMEASKIAGRLREQRVERVDTSDANGSELPSSETVSDGLTTTGEVSATTCDVNTRDKEALPATNEDTQTNSDMYTSAVEKPSVTCDSLVQDPIETAPSDNDEVQETKADDLQPPADAESSSAASSGVPTKTNFVVPHRSLADELVDESESSVDADSMSPHLNLSPMEIGDALEIPTSASMPELSYNNTSPLNHKLQKWWKESSRQLHEKSMSMLRSSGLNDDSADGGDSSNHSDRGVGTFLGLSKSIVAADDPLQGVIHLDKPLLLCQEIYTRIIGNHQTSKVSKEKVLTLLRQDMEQHLQHKKESDELDAANEQSDIAAALSADSSKSEDGKSNQPEENNSVTSPTSSETNRVDSSKTTDTSADSNVESPISTAKKEQPLVGYWVWENTLRTHKMKMHVAKGADLALHVVLAVLVNQLRYERNAIAMAV
jgi:hypothetical protein